MSDESQSSSPKLPPRHRPTLGNLNKNTLDSGLWDEIGDLEDIEPRPPVEERETKLPKPRSSFESQAIEPKSSSQNIPSSPRHKDAILTNITRLKPGERSPLSKPTTPLATASSIDELSDWDEAPATPIAKKAEPEISKPKEAKKPLQAKPEMPAVAGVQDLTHGEKPIHETAPEAKNKDQDDSQKVDLGFGEFVEKAAQVEPAILHWKQWLRFSKLESIGLAAMALILVTSTIIFFVVGINRLPQVEERADAADFPMKGKSITIESVETFWRKPITTGENPDTFRRGTVLLPVIEITCSEGSGALRIIFRDSDGNAMGDTKMLSLREGQTAKAAATAGFEDMGLFTAYRAGNEKPWTIEVYEAPSIDVRPRDFVSLFKTNISINQR